MLVEKFTVNNGIETEVFYTYPNKPSAVTVFIASGVAEVGHLPAAGGDYVYTTVTGPTSVFQDNIAGVRIRNSHPEQAVGALFAWRVDLP